MLQCIEKSECFPVTLETLKEHLRLIGFESDRYLENLLCVATVAVEDFLQKTLLQKTWEFSFDGDYPKLQAFYLPAPPIVSIISVVENGDSPKAKRYSMMPVAGRAKMTVWGHRIRVTYKAGYGTTGSAIPFPIRHGITLLVAEMFEKRVDGDVIFSPAVTSLLQPYRVMACA